MTRKLLGVLIASASIGVVILSFTSLVQTDVWWVRSTDFPRLQYIVVLTALLAIILVSRLLSGPLRGLLAVALVAATIFNVFKIAPYFMPAEEHASCTEDQSVSVLVANVQKGNRTSEGLVSLVRNVRPDVFVALETDEWWDSELSPLSEELSYTASQVQDGYFGMHLFSRLPLSDTETLFPVDRDTPAIFTDVELLSGQSVRLYAMHPRPPQPDQSSADRDAQLMYAALSAREEDNPVIVAGDLNATPWERTIQRMQRIGDFIDPRLEHGYLPTYDATSWWKSWPIDQVIHQASLSTSDVTVHPFVGSDHKPFEVTLCFQDSKRSAPATHDGDISQAQRTIAKARQNSD